MTGFFLAKVGERRWERGGNGAGEWGWGWDREVVGRDGIGGGCGNVGIYTKPFFLLEYGKDGKWKIFFGLLSHLLPPPPPPFHLPTPIPKNITPTPPSPI